MDFGGQALRQVDDVARAFGLIGCRKVAAIQPRRPGAHADEARQRLEQRGLAAAVRSQQRGEFAGGQRQAQPVQHVLPAIAGLQLVHLEHRGRKGEAGFMAGGGA